MKILLAIDDSKFSQAALRMVVAQNRPKTTRVRVLHVVNPRETPLAYAPALNEEQKDELRKVRASISRMTKNLHAAGFEIDTIVRGSDIREEELGKAQELVARAARRLHTAGFKVDAIVQEGDIQREIIETAAEWHSNLIVVGSHGRKGLKRFLLGSVSEFVASHAPCSVAIVRLPANRRK